MNKVLTATLIALLAGALLATPTIESVSLRSGTTLPRYNGEIVRAYYSVSNPDDTAADLTVQVVPDGNSGGAFYYRRLTLPPHTAINGFFPVVFASAPRYIYRLVQHRPQGDVELMHGDLPVTFTRPQGAATTAPQDDEFGRIDAADILYIGTVRGNTGNRQSDFPNLYKDRELNNSARFLNFSARNSYAPPANLAEYRQLSAVIMLRDEYDRITPLQYNALRDYVRGGGLLVVGGGTATQGLHQSPLRPLLPVTPARTRHLEDGNALRQAWGLQPREYQRRDDNGDLLEVPSYDFQEVAVAPDATILKYLGDSGLPMAVLRPYGLGTVLWLAFDPIDLTANELDVRATLWNFILRHANFVPTSLRPDSQLLLENIQQQLLGYSIPPFRTLGIYLTLYVVAAVLLLGVCAKLHHPATGWGLVCLLGLAMTFAIVAHAHNLSANQPQRQVNAITLRTWDGAPGPQTTFANLASREDTTLDLRLDNADGFLFPSPPKPSVESTETALERSRLLVSTDGRLTSLVRLNLQENRPRAANWFLASRDLETPPKGELPILQIAPDGTLSLDEWNVPEELQPFSRALLMLPSAIHPLNTTGGRLIGIAQEALENDTVFVQVREYLAASQLRSPALCLVSIRRADMPDAAVQVECEDGEFGAYDYLLTLVPLKLQWPTQGDSFTVPADLTWMTIDGNSLLARSWSFGKCTGLSLATAFGGDEKQARRNRLPVAIAFPPTVPAGEFLGAEVQYSILENSSVADIAVRVYDPAGANGVEPTATAPQSSVFGPQAASGYDSELARFTVNFVPVPTSSQPIGENSELGSSSREQSWWLNQARAAITFRRATAPTAP